MTFEVGSQLTAQGSCCASMPECDFCCHPISAVESGCEQTDIKLWSHEAHKLLTVGEVLWS